MTIDQITLIAVLAWIALNWIVWFWVRNVSEIDGEADLTWFTWVFQISLGTVIAEIVLRWGDLSRPTRAKITGIGGVLIAIVAVVIWATFFKGELK